MWILSDFLCPEGPAAAGSAGSGSQVEHSWVHAGTRTVPGGSLPLEWLSGSKAHGQGCVRPLSAAGTRGHPHVCVHVETMRLWLCFMATSAGISPYTLSQSQECSAGKRALVLSSKSGTEVPQRGESHTFMFGPELC